MTHWLRQFHQDEDGVVAIELLLVIPILFWALMSTFVFFDAFRADSISVRAALTIADMYSREEDNITPAYLDGTRSLLRTLTEAEADPDFRVTAYQFFENDPATESDDEFRVIWSKNRGMAPDYDNATFANITDQLPELADGGISLLIETRTEYTAPFSMALAPFGNTAVENVEFTTFTFIDPRPPFVCWQENSTATPLCGF